MNNGNTQSRSTTTGGTGSASQDFGHSQSSGSGLAESAKGMAAEASEKLLNTAERQKIAGADFMSNMAGAVRRAAGEFEQESPQTAQYIRYAADQMATLSDSFRRRDLGQMMSEVQSFARRQPTAFLGATFLAGFAAMRFLRSSAPAASRHRDWRDDPMDDDRYGTPTGSMSGSGMSGSDYSGMRGAPGMSETGAAAMRPARETSSRSGL